ncbi:MAG: glycosyltransferase family 2 protein [Fusobacteriaceae bacterium]
MEPLVSVIIPVYNIQDYIEKCLESVRESSYKNIEILAIDDCSTDESKNIIKKYSEIDSRILIIENKKNEGVCYTRNLGLKNVNGKYLIFVDGDDFISKFWIENLVQKIEQKKCDVVIGNSKNYKDKFFYEYKIKDLRNEKYIKFEKIRLNKNGVIWNKIYNSEFLKKNTIFFSDNRLNYGEDLEFVYKALSKADRIYYSDVGDYYYRNNRPLSLSQNENSQKRVGNLVMLLKSLLIYSKENNRYNKKTLKKIAKDIMIEYLENDKLIVDIEVIRSVSIFIPFICRLKYFRKKIKIKVGLK